MDPSFLVLTYAQYRPASYDAAVAIGERREERFPMSATVDREVEKFLDKGTVRCGAAFHRRQMISVQVQKPFPKDLRPHRELVPLYEGD